MKLRSCSVLRPVGALCGVLWLLSLSVVGAGAGTIRVPADQPTIQQAINAANTADVVLVSPGIYFERLDYNGKAISVQSTAGPESTIIDGSNSGPVVHFHSNEGAQSVLRGFTIRRGNAVAGAGILLTGASPTIVGNILREHFQRRGGSGAAIGGTGASPLIEGNYFYFNQCGEEARSGVISFYDASSPRIVNNIIYQNFCRAISMALPSGTNPVVANNTIVSNGSAGVRSDGQDNSTHLYSNNIIVGNAIGYVDTNSFPGKEAKWTNNLVFGNGTADYAGGPNQTGMNGNISADPAFISSTNFRLRANSPAIDAGTLSVPALPANDFDGNPRVVDGDGNGSSLPDIGAYEFPTPGSMGNVSTRLAVGANDDVLIEGFIVQGPSDSTKRIMVRALGPSLSSFGVMDALPNPRVEIRNSAGVAVATNDDWRVTQPGGIITGDQSSEISSSGLAPNNDLESAIIANLAPGNYTAVVRGVGNDTGTGVVDAFDMSAGSAARLANIATRGLVQPGDKLMIAGFIIQSASVRAAVRAIGPSLIQFGITNALADTTLEVRDKDGMLMLANDDWKSDPAQKQELESNGLQPSHDLEAALIMTIQPGQYTAQVRGKGDESGIGVVEVYFLE